MLMYQYKMSSSINTNVKAKFPCAKCGKLFSAYQSRWVHSKKCLVLPVPDATINKIETEIQNNKDDNNTNSFESMDREDIIKMLIKNNTMLTDSINQLTHQYTLLHAKIDSLTNCNVIAPQQQVYQTPPVLNQPIPKVIYQAAPDIMEIDEFIDIVKEEIEETTKLEYFDLDKPNKNILCEKVAGVIESVYSKIESDNKPVLITDAKREKVEYKSNDVIIDDDAVFALLLKLEKQFRERQLELFKQKGNQSEFAAFYRVLSQDVNAGKFKKMLMKFIAKK
tara:strand:+ start:415 stop:1254 length:840 start_codon:yes stop_codon:yes gene_type:complete